MSSIYNWNLQAGENSASDEIVNWTEGQAPSTINNSARGMMQRIREYLADTGGSLQGVVTNDEAAKSSSIKVDTKARYGAYSDDLMIRFQATAKNIGNTILAIDALPPMVVYKNTFGGFSALYGGEIQQHCIYEVVYRNFSNVGAGWFLLNPTHLPPELPPNLQPFQPGTIAAFAMQNLPKGWLECDGRAISRTTYSSLLNAIGLTWGIGDGVNTFNIPDLRGMFLRGFDAGRGIDRNRAFADTQQAAFKVHRVEGQTGGAVYGRRNKRVAEQNNNALVENDSVIWILNRARREVLENMPEADRQKLINEVRKLVEHHHAIVGHFVGGAETRPVNMSIIYAIKT